MVAAESVSGNKKETLQIIFTATVIQREDDQKGHVHVHELFSVSRLTGTRSRLYTGRKGSGCVLGGTQELFDEV